MDNNDKLRLRDPAMVLTSELLMQTLGDSYAAYEAFQDELPSLEIEQEWQVYTSQGVVCKGAALLGNAEGHEKREKSLLAACF